MGTNGVETWGTMNGMELKGVIRMKKTSDMCYQSDTDKKPHRHQTNENKPSVSF
jgi:hypothetical protein